MHFLDPTTFTIDVTQADIDASGQVNTQTCLVKALQRVYDDLPDIRTNIGVIIVGGSLVSIVNIALDAFVYGVNTLAALAIATQQSTGIKPLEPFTATLTILSNII